METPETTTENGEPKKENLLVKIGNKVLGIVIVMLLFAVVLVVVSTLKMSSYHPG